MAQGYDVLCYGAISLDISGRTAAPYPCGGQLSATDYVLSPGGDAALVALTLAGLGLKVALAGGPIGDDPMGDYLSRIFSDAGVDLIGDRMGKTSVTAVALTPSGERSTITYHDATPLEAIPVPVDLIPGSRYLYACGCYGQDSITAGVAARESGIPSVLNFDPRLLDALGIFDTVIASSDTASGLSSDLIAAAEILRVKGTGLAIVTMGDKGCVSSNGGLLTVPAYRIDAVDTTGAGAAFAAGFIYARLQGFNVLDSLRMATAAGAYKCLVRGSYRQFTSKELFSFVNSMEYVRN